MVKNYFVIAWRNLIKQPFYSIINISGLGIGFIAVFFIFLFVKDELSFDRFHVNKDQLYRLHFFGKLGDQVINSSATPGPAGPLFSQTFPEVKAACRLRSHGVYSVKSGIKAFREPKVIFSDSTFLDLFTFKTIEGSVKTALSQSGHVVINRSIAKKYFGNDPDSYRKAIGKILTFDNDKSYMVSAIIEDMPQNSHMQFDFLLPLTSRKDSYEDNWGSTNYYTYFLLKEHAHPSELSAKMNDLFIEKFKIVLKEYLNASWEDLLKQGNFARVELFPVVDIHLNAGLDDELMPGGSKSQVYIFSIIGLVILLLACINFINLSTARASIRAREVGVRKTIGALKSALAIQFVSESVLFSTLSGLFSIAIMWPLVPVFNRVAGKEILFSNLFNPPVLIPFMGIIVITGFLAGIYPAFYLASLEPIKVLKGTWSASRKSFFRNGLTVFQFFISVVLIIGSMTIYKQLKYMQEKKLGFNKDQVLIISDYYLLGKNKDVFKNRIKSFSQVKSASVSDFLPASTERNTSSIINGKVASPANAILVNNGWTDRDFVKTMELDIIQGRDFDKDILTDSTGVIINEALARSLGYPDQQVQGKIIGLPQEESKLTEYHVLGVIKDFNFRSLQYKIEPLAIFNGGSSEYICIRMNTNQVMQGMQHIEALWNELAPGNPFTYSFMDERYQQLYASEQKTGTISFVFSFLAIFIAGMGLLGLATYSIQQRIKEIGIRKVLGASTSGIMRMMSKDFIVLISLSICFAAPMAWYLMNKWLQGFEYRIALNGWIFLSAGLGILFLALAIVIIQTLKAALTNPVKSLRTE
ncbi:MAG: ABC transporter permease [Saprospiraceae bacterium]